MEDNEENQNLAHQVLMMAQQGCMLKLREPDLLIAVGYAEMWLDRNAIFYCELGDGETGKQHVLKFATFTPRSNQVVFYDKEGNLIAGLAPYVEWPEVDAHQMQAAWEAWQKDKEGLAGCKAAADEWRHADF
jgi:hypothetical protein